MMKVCVQPRSGGRRAYSVRPEKRRGRFSLSPREERAGRELERGETDEKRPPLPGPLLLWGRRGRREAPLRSRQTTCQTSIGGSRPLPFRKEVLSDIISAMQPLSPPDTHFLSAAAGWYDLGNITDAK